MHKQRLTCFEKFYLQAHRGLQSLYPENTLIAFHEAWKLGCDCVELDLLFSKDGFVVIHHDFYIKDQAIIDLNLREIKAFPVGDFLNPKFPDQQKVFGERIPTLAELFLLAQKFKETTKRQVRFNLEIKSDPRSPRLTGSLEAFITKIVQCVEEFEMHDFVYYSSFDPKAIEILKKIDPLATAALILEPNFEVGQIDSLIKICKNIGAEIVSPFYSSITKEFLEKLQRSNFKVVTWTVNLPEDFEKLKNLGVDGIITDYPQRFL